MLPEIGILLIAVLGLAFLGWVLACTMSGHYEPIILVWALLAPLGNALLSFPHEHAVITLHRLVILPVFFLTLILPSFPRGKVTQQLASLAVIWMLFCFGAVLSVVNSPDIWLSSTRVTVDSFLLPLLLAAILYRTFRVTEHLSSLHSVVCVVSLYLLIIAVLEVITGRALLPQSDVSGVLYAGVGPFEIVRPTGPYSNPAILALVGMINLFLLLFLRRNIGPMMPSRRLIHWIGCISAVLVSLITLTRGVVVAYGLVILIMAWRAPGVKRRAFAMIGAVALFASVAVFPVVVPGDVAQERTSGDDLWARVAQQAQTLRVFEDHPLTGVGLGNFIRTAETAPKYEASFAGVAAVYAPHNLLGSLLAETGLVGTVPFVAAQVLLVAVFWRVRDSRAGRLADMWLYFLAIFAAYWVLNMDFGIGYYSDLNLWFVFALSVIYRYGCERNVGAQVLSRVRYRPSFEGNLDHPQIA